MVVWIIGLSSAGKTTLGQELVRQWRLQAQNTVLVDGDQIRAALGAAHPEPFSVDGRKANARRISELCLWLDQQQVNVVCCILSIFPEMRDEYRQRYSDYREVFLDAPLSVLMARDDKGVYRGDRGPVVGVDLPFPAPTAADIRITVSEPPAPAEQTAQALLNQLLSE